MVDVHGYGCIMQFIRCFHLGEIRSSHGMPQEHALIGLVAMQQVAARWNMTRISGSRRLKIGDGVDFLMHG
jgi:hypothetical protein